MKNKTKSYFNSVASNYSKSSSKGFWNLLRRNEKNTILKLIKNKKFKNILELGSGSGFYTKHLLNYSKNNITCVDFSQEMLDKINLLNVTKINSNIEHFKSKKKYDLIFCAGTIEFTNDVYKVFSNVKKMMSEDSFFLILVPDKNIWGLLYKLFHITHGVKINLFTNKKILHYSDYSGLEIIQMKKAFPFSKCYLFKII